MKLGAEIGVRLLRVFYWALWVAEAGAVCFIGGVLLSENVRKFDTEDVAATLIILSAVACAHYILTIPIGRKLAEDKADN
ncbi:hypothetical protein OAD24_06035 [Pseudomonadales bacterium]|nr:hypothetical protein [Pseudomonadales bacterium]